MEPHEIKTNYNQGSDKKQTDSLKPHEYGNVLAGLIVLVVGSLLLARQAGVELPHWLFTWQMLVIAIGIFSGAKHGFRDWGWLIPVTVGGIFLAGEFVEDFSVRQYWPIIVIVVGLTMIFNASKKNSKCRNW
ncbi:MAG: hypothetical protein JNM57_09475 [Cyclobacteriaceae bacterium]|nr:hypothetical protein [Cyclobacteriaceae bacterium]